MWRDIKVTEDQARLTSEFRGRRLSREIFEVTVISHVVYWG
jgi:hypothetical protein